MITTEQIKSLRDATGISVMQCKEALEEAKGNMDKAVAILKEKGLDVSEKKKNRALNAGVIGSYVHSTGDVGAMVELFCETDFVAKNEEFKALAYNLAMQVAALSPESKEALLDSEFIKDPSRKIKDLLKDAVQKFGENADIGEFSRLSVSGR